MAIVVNAGPVNPAQVITHLGCQGCTVRANDDDGTWEVEAPVSEVDLEAALAAIVYDATVTSAA